MGHFELVISISFDPTQFAMQRLSHITFYKLRLEGSYSPVVLLKLDNGEASLSPPLTSIAITVHPKSMMTQIVTNKITANLTLAAYFLGIIGALDIIYHLWTDV